MSTKAVKSCKTGDCSAGKEKFGSTLWVLPKVREPVRPLILIYGTVKVIGVVWVVTLLPLT